MPIQDPFGPGGGRLSPQERSLRIQEAQDRGWLGEDALSGDLQTDPDTTLERPTDTSRPLTDPAVEDESFAESALDVAGKTIKAVVRGGEEAINETVDFFVPGDFQIISDDWMPEESEGGYAFVEDMAQFGFAMFGFGKFLKPLRLGARAARAVRGLGSTKLARTAATVVPTETAAVAADFFAFDPNEERLSNMLAEIGPEATRPIFEYLEADEDDPAVVGRMKAAIEGSLAGLAVAGTIEAAARFIRLTKIKRLFKSGEIDGDEAMRRASNVREEPFSTDEAYGIIHDQDESFISIKNIENYNADARVYLPDDFDIPDVADGDIAYMWHVGDKQAGIMREGLKSRDQLGGVQGLGGGPSHTVSVTYSGAHAENIEITKQLVARVAGDGETEFSYDLVREVTDRFSELLRKSDQQPERNAVARAIGEWSYAAKRISGTNQRAAEISEEILEGWANTVTQTPEELADIISDWMRRNLSGQIVDGHDARRVLTMELLKGLDARHPDDIVKSFFIGDAARLVDNYLDTSPDDIKTFQVIAKENLDSTGLTRQVARSGGNVEHLFPEFELRFHPDDIEVLDRVRVANERQVAALNMVAKRRLSKGIESIPTEKLKEFNARLSTRINAGRDIADADLYKFVGQNLGLLVKKYDDYRALVRSFAEAAPEDLKAAARGEGERSFAALDEASDEVVESLFGEGATLNDLRRWIETELEGVRHEDVPVMVDAAMKISMLVGQDIMKISRALSLSKGGPESVFLEDLMLDVADVFGRFQMAITGTKSQAGWNLGSLRKLGQAPEEVAEALSESATKATRASKLSPAEARQLARNLWLTNGHPEKIRKVLIHTAEQVRNTDEALTGIDKLNWFRVGMMLSGVKTQLINIINTAFTSFQVPVERYWAGKASGDAVLSQFARDEIAGFYYNVGEAFKMMRESWRRNEAVLDPGFRTDEGMFRHAPEPLSWIGSMAARMINLPGKALMAGDEFFKQLNYRNHVRAQALARSREAAAELGLRGAEYDRFVEKKLAEVMQASFTKEGHALNPFGLEHARYSTFTGDLEKGTWGHQIQRIVNEHPEARIVLPFVRTPINIFRFAWQRTPLLGRLQHQMRQDLKAGGQRAAMARARLSAGWGLWGMGVMLASAGRITGAGPSNPQLRQQWLNAGNQPYSIKFPNGASISYRRMEPLATAIGIIADAVEGFGELAEDGDQEMTTIAYTTVGALMASASSKTFLVGLSDFLGAVAEGQEHKVQRAMTSIATSFSPNFFNQINADPYYREARGVIDEFRKKLPGFSETLEPTRNLLGEAVLRPPAAFGLSLGGVGDYINRSLNPFTTMAKTESDEVFSALMELGRAMPYPQPTRMEGNIDLRDREKWDNGTGQSPYDRMFEIVNNPTWGGPSLREMLGQVIKSDAWQALSVGTETFRGGGRYKLAKRIVDRYYEAAEKQVYREYPALQQEIIRLRGAKVRSLLASDQATLDQISPPTD